MDIEKASEVGKQINTTKTRAYMESELGWKIDGPFYTTVPTLKVEYKEKCTEDVDVLIQHLLETMIIKDQFTVDTERTDFVAKDETLSKFSSRYSKLKANKLLIVIYKMEDIIEKIGKKYPRVSAELTTVAKLSEINQKLAGYKKLSFEEKVLFTRTLDDVIYRFLEVLSR